MPDWDTQFKYDDGSESSNRKVPEKTTRNAAKDGRFNIRTEGASLGAPVKGSSDVSVEKFTTPEPHIRVEIRNPRAVYYIVSENDITKAENPGNTTFEKERGL